MRELYLELLNRYKSFIEQRESFKDQEIVKEKAKILLQDIRKSGEVITDTDQRNVLFNAASDLGETIRTLSDSGIFPPVSLYRPIEKIEYVIDFVDRTNELQFITNIYCPPYLLINAPIGYGKSRLVENVKKRLQQQNWLCIHIECSREIIYSIETLAADILKQLGEKQTGNLDITTPEKAGAKVATGMLKVLKDDQKNILLLIDQAEVLDDQVSKQLLNGCIPAVQEGLGVAATPIKLRVICAGRHLAHWKKLSSKLPLDLMLLTSFDFPVVYETVETFSTKSNTKTSVEYTQDFAAHLMYFTGGHPGCMVNILSKDFGSPIRLIVSNENEYYEKMMKPVIQKIQKQIPTPLRKVFETLSIFRMYNYPLLQKIIEKKIIPYKGNAMSLEGELMTTYLVERKYGFIRDDIVRRLFAIRLRKEKGGKPFLELCLKAKQIFEEYLQETTYHPHSVALEGLYQELQFEYYQSDQASEAKETLYKKFFASDGILQKYLNLLADKPDAKDILANFVEVLENNKDWELQFTLNFFLRKDEHYTNDPYQELLKTVQRFVRT